MAQQIEPLDHYTKKEAKAIIDAVKKELNTKIDNYITMSTDGNKPLAENTKIWMEVKSVDRPD